MIIRIASPSRVHRPAPSLLRRELQRLPPRVLPDPNPRRRPGLRSPAATLPGVRAIRHRAEDWLHAGLVVAETFYFNCVCISVRSTSLFSYYISLVYEKSKWLGLLLEIGAVMVRVKLNRYHFLDDSSNKIEMLQTTCRYDAFGV